MRTRQKNYEDRIISETYSHLGPDDELPDEEDAASDKSEFYESELYVCSPTMQEVERAAIADAKRYIEEDRI